MVLFTVQKNKACLFLHIKLTNHPPCTRKEGCLKKQKAVPHEIQRFTCCDTPLGNKGAAKSTLLFFVCCEAVTNPENLSGCGERWTCYFSGRSLGHWTKTKPKQEAWRWSWVNWNTKQRESGNSWQPCLWLRKPINTNPTKSLSSQRGFKYYRSVRFSSNMIEIWTKWLCLNPPAVPLFYAKR